MAVRAYRRAQEVKRVIEEQRKGLINSQLCRNGNYRYSCAHACHRILCESSQNEEVKD